MNRESNKSRIISLIMTSTGISRNAVDNLVERYPQLLEVDEHAMYGVLVKLQFKYLFTRADMQANILYVAKMLANPETFQAKDELMKQIFNISDVEIGKIFKSNPTLINLNNEDIKKLVLSLESNCNLPREATKQLFLQSKDLITNDTENTVTDIKNKLSLLYLYGFNLKQVLEHPTICCNKLENIDYKIKLACLSNLPLDRYIAREHYLHNKERIYSRYMGLVDGRYDLKIYSSDALFTKDSGYTAQQLEALYPWDENSATYINNSFTSKFPNISNKIQQLFEYINNENTSN